MSLTADNSFIALSLRRTGLESPRHILQDPSPNKSLSNMYLDSEPAKPPQSRRRRKPKQISISCVASHVGEFHESNPRHRNNMEDETAIEAFDEFPGLFVGVYDGHGGITAATLLKQMLHRYFLDEILTVHGCMEVVEVEDGGAQVECLRMGESEGSSECSTPPYEMEEDSDIDHPLNTRDLDVGDAFARAYSKADAVLKVQRCGRVGATAVTAFVRTVKGVGRVLTIANCGDSRALLSRAGRALRLSKDHRPTDEMEKNRIEGAGGFVTGSRVNGILNVSRAFGDHSMKSLIIPTPAIREVVLDSRDDFLVLACDGLWDFVPEADVVRLAQDAFDRGLECEEVAEVLVQESMDRRSTDNISVVVVQFDMMDE